MNEFVKSPAGGVWTRRRLLQAGAAASALLVLPGHASARTIARRLAAFGGQYDLADPPTVRALALAAVDAAKSAGATYAEARVTRTVTQSFNGLRRVEDPFGRETLIAEDVEELALGVRVLVRGGWGFAASPFWDLDEAVRLAREAVTQATANDAATPRKIELARVSAASGTWVMPGLDPFQVPIEEKIEFMQALQTVFHDRPRRGRWIRLVSASDITLYRQEHALATTDGSYVTQTVYRTGGDVRAGVESSDHKVKGPRLPATGLTLAGAGWDLFRSAKLEDQLPALAERSAALVGLKKRPVDIGRYDVVCDAETMASLVDATLGRATQLDRVMGYEANAGGTSYLGPDPLAALGTFDFGAPLLSVTADRSTTRGLATVRWDAEGTTPTLAPLVSAGVLRDFQTTREQASWIAPWYQRQNRPARSHGYAGAQSALHVTQQCTPNLRMAPGKENVGFDELIAGVTRGVAIVGGRASTDFQSRAGAGSGTTREIVNGKLGDELAFAGFLFDSVQLWKELSAIGGPASTSVIAGSDDKGEPSQTTMYTVEAVPGLIRNMSIIDMARKA